VRPAITVSGCRQEDNQGVGEQLGRRGNSSALSTKTVTAQVTPGSRPMTIVLTRSATVRDIEEHSFARAASNGHSSGFLVRVQRAVIRPWRRELATGADAGQTAGSAGSLDLVALRELVDGNPIR
jgi:hypothetical protein